MTELIDKKRERVKASYLDAVKLNEELFAEDNPKATKEYIFENQILDAYNIIDMFYKNRDLLAVSITKRTKVGMDGLMIYIAYLYCTHIENDFIIDYKNVRFLTGMSNKSWEDDFKNKVPKCFENNIFHHGQLKNSKLNDLKNSLIIIDEIDTGDRTGQVLHKELKKNNILDNNYLKENNIKLILVSATMADELSELKIWGNLHQNYKMTIPNNYIGHNDFIQLGIIKQFKKIDSITSAEDWINEDIINNYKTDYRVHLIRLKPDTNTNINFIKDACINLGIIYRPHNSEDRLSQEDQKEFFEDMLTNHIVVGVKGFYRRANLIPNKWKLRIGAVHELCVNKTEMNVQVQGLPGRMTGYWREYIIDKNHKTGPYRTQIGAINIYEEWYNNPSAYDKKTNETMYNPSNWIIDYEPPDLSDPRETIPIIINLDKIQIDNLINSKKRKVLLLEILKTINNELYQKLKDYYYIQCTNPNTDKSYKKHITDVTHASFNNIKFKIDIKSENKTKNCYNCYIDHKENRICFIIWHGALNSEQNQNIINYN
jgi:hypothetical protein